jgi:hypothetical protein
MKKKFNNKHTRIEFFRHEDLNKPVVYIDLHGGSSAVLNWLKTKVAPALEAYCWDNK